MMVALKGLGRFAAILTLVALVIPGCINKGEEDDPLVNPNVEAVLTTGQTTGGSTGTGTSGPGILTINPSSVRIAIGQSMTFTAAGGEPTYSFSIIQGSGTINAGTGMYVAPSSPGSDLVRVTDSATPPGISDANVLIYDPATEPTPYQIVCTDYTPPATAIVVPPGTTVNFQIQNGAAPDSFNVTNQSGGSPQGFWVASRSGSWLVGGVSADDGSVVDTLQVFDSSSPLNVSTLKIYVCSTPLAVTPTWGIVPALSTRQFTATSLGVGQLSWSVPVATNQSGGSVPIPSNNATVMYTAGSTTQGVIGASDVVQVDDSFPSAAPLPPGYPAGLHQVAQARVTVPGLGVYPTEAHIRPSTPIQLNALGGSGSYTWSIFQNRSGTSFSSSTGATLNFTPGTLEGLDIVELQDTGGGSIRIPITVCNSISSRSFTALTTYYPSTGLFGDYAPLDMVVDDFDGDGSPDVAAPCSATTRTTYTNLSGNQVSVLLGSGIGSFASSATKYTIPGTGPWGIASGDFNADGNRDIAVTCYTSNELIVMFGDGTGGFPNAGGTLNWITMSLGQGMAPTGLTTYNFDRASGDDLVVCDGVSGQVMVYFSNGGGAGNPPAGFRLAASLQVADQDGSDSNLP
ncbi:MAG: FG-GAP repeat domain-containing protein, partial [Planctomycetota bacterium]